MWGAILAGVKAIAGLVGIAEWFQRRAERNEYRKAGRDEQKVADLSARESQASEANEIDEDVRSLDDDALQRELRGKD